MKKKTLHPIMIALLALFVLLQAFCLTAFGAENPEVCIPAGTETDCESDPDRNASPGQ